MRILSVCFLRPGIIFCAVLALVVTANFALAEDSPIRNERRIPRSEIVEDPYLLTLIMPKPVAYARGAAVDPQLFQVSASLHRWLQNFGAPVVCNMIFCHGSCADFDDSCPSFKRPLLEGMLAENRGCNMQSQPNDVRLDASALPATKPPQSADSCCSPIGSK